MNPSIVEDYPSVQPMETQTETLIDVEYLGTDQSWAFNIVHQHLQANLDDKKPPQLLMIAIGPRRMGKAELINATTWLFKSLGAKNVLAKTATSGVAATLIGGTMLHYWGSSYDHVQVRYMDEHIKQQHPN